MVLPVPIIPETITVHLGRPNEDAPNITVPFTYYIKNVASSEIYPTWPISAIRANIYAQLSFTLNRIYTEWYPSQGYDFDITNTTQYDHYFVRDRDIFENISDIVDEMFDSYIRKIGQVEPFLSPYCDGKQTRCDGLEQWGTVALAEEGYNSFEILQYYYGDDIEIVQNVPIRTNLPTYPGIPLQEGNFGSDVILIQLRLNRIAANYPAIPKIDPANGDYGPTTSRAVREFQRIFNLPVDGIVGKGTWNRISYVYTAVKNLAEVESEGIQYGFETMQFPEVLEIGMTGNGVDLLQYFLSVIGLFQFDIPEVRITGTFNHETEQAIRIIQQQNGLPVNGIVDRITWDTIYRIFRGMAETIPGTDQGFAIIPYGGVVLRQGMSGESVMQLQEYLAAISQVYTNIPYVEPIGTFGPQTQNAVLAFQREFRLQEDGLVGEETWNEILNVYRSILRTNNPNIPQFPGWTLAEGQTDSSNMRG